jgi:hypothetical protein
MRSLGKLSALFVKQGDLSKGWMQTEQTFHSRFPHIDACRNRVDHLNCRFQHDKFILNEITNCFASILGDK